MVTRLSVTLVVGALLSMSSLVHADIPVCSARKHRLVLAPATALSTVPVNHHLMRDFGDMATARLTIRGNNAWGTIIGCRGNTLQGGRGPIRFSDASGPDAWDRPKDVTALLWTLAQAQATEPLHTSKIDFKKPVLYSLSLMAIGFGGFAASGALDHNPSVDNFIKSYKSPPHLDNDSPLVNFVLHPLWGSETYLRAREAHFGVYGSIAFSMGASIVWEYLFESWSAHPSTQDLIFTTGIGWIIGEGRYYLKNKLGPNNYWWIDPIHTALEYFNIGINQDREGNTQTTLRLTWKF